MSADVHPQEPDDFFALFEQFADSAFRLETRDLCDVAEEQEEFAAFLSGQVLSPRTPADNPWLALIARATESGRTFERVRIVEQPLNDYSRFEFAAYRDSTAAGEHVRVVDRGSLHRADRAWADKDFWIFDDETVAVLRYDDAGHFLRAEQDRDVDAYISVKRRALAISVELATFFFRDPG
jgi:hypothetical protein